LTPLRSDAYYVLEAYSPTSDSVRLALTVTDQAGKAVVSTPARTAQLPAGGGVLSGVVPLAGLPAGEYRLTARLETSKGTVERTAEFTKVADMQQTMARERADGGAGSTDEGYFGPCPTRIRRGRRPSRLIATSGRCRPKKDLSIQWRRFLTQF
jgi:hypothetical protein